MLVLLFSCGADAHTPQNVSAHFARTQMRYHSSFSFGCRSAWRCKSFFLSFCGPTTLIRTCPKHTNHSVIGIRFQRRRHSFRPPGKSVGQERAAARSLRPEILAGHYPPRNSLAALAQTGAAADATSQNFSLRAPASVPMGGELHQYSPVCLQAVRRRHISKCFCALRAMSNAMFAVKYAGADPHPSRGFPACPWKICVAASRLPCL